MTCSTFLSFFLTVQLFFLCCSVTGILQRILKPISGVLVLAWHFESLHSLVAQFSVARFKLFEWTALFFWIDVFDSDYVFCLPHVPFLPDWADFWSTFSGASLTAVSLPLCFCTCVHICEHANTHTHTQICLLSQPSLTTKTYEFFFA